MKTKTQNLGQKFLNARVLLRAVICTLVLVAFAYPDAGYAATKKTQTTTSKTTGKTTKKTTVKKKVTTKPTKVSVKEDEEPIIIEDKTSQFSDVLGEASTSDNDSSKSALAEKIRAQRAALDARDAVDTANAKMQNSMANGQNACDFGLRECMKKKCGNNYSKCSKDTDTLWGDKMDACRRDLPCTGEEYRIFTTEIKADRDMNTKIGSYTSIIDCGNRYNDCVITECGKTFSKCLGKSAGDKAIEKCKKIANECKEQDSGLPSRMMEVFGTLRQDAEKQIKKDEEKLYSLRDSMADTCKMLGAMFDERTLDCVYTVNFFAGDKNTLFASKKAYAGSTFNCDQNWFGIDVTTFKENAYRLTRSQTAASSAMLGSGVGTAVGSITSGALNRALDRQKAEKALKKAKEEGKSSEEEDSDNSKDEEDNSNEKECTKDENCGAGQTCTNGKCKAKDADKGSEWEIETNSEKIRQCDTSLSTKPTAWGTGWCFFNPETDELTNTPVPEWFDAFCGSEEKMYQGCVTDPDDPTYADCKSYLEWRQKNPNVTCCELKKAAGNENEASMCLHCSNAWHCMYGEGRPIKGECDNKSELLKDPKKYPMPC